MSSTFGGPSQRQVKTIAVPRADSESYKTMAVLAAPDGLHVLTLAVHDGIRLQEPPRSGVADD